MLVLCFPLKVGVRDVIIIRLTWDIKEKRKTDWFLLCTTLNTPRAVGHRVK